jgi:hypothetical protein
MSNLPLRAETALAALAGVGLGVAAGLWGPLLLALALSHDPIHSGPYLDAIHVLLLLLPPLTGILLATFTLKRIHYRGERVVIWAGLLSLPSLIVVWLLYFGS